MIMDMAIITKQMAETSLPEDSASPSREMDLPWSEAPE